MIACLVQSVEDVRMDERVVTTADLLDVWRDATRAAELAQRLAQVAQQVAEDAEAGAMASEEIAQLAERAAGAAAAAAASARAAAGTAKAGADRRRSQVSNAQVTQATTSEAERHARDQFHRTEDEAEVPA